MKRPLIDSRFRALALHKPNSTIAFLVALEIAKLKFKRKVWKILK